MGNIKIKLSDKVEKVFRRLAMHRFGYQKGAISEAAENAIEEWNHVQEVEEGEEEMNWDSLVGVMKGVKKTSVELQHEAWDFVDKKYSKKNNKRKKM